MQFDFYTPTRIHFGCGILEHALEAEKECIQGRVFIVSSASARLIGVLDRVKEQLRKMPSVEQVDDYCDVTANPKVEEINRGITLASDFRASMIIGLGGGSAMDAAKAIAVGTGGNELIDRYFFENAIPTACTLPTVMIPTTAGTGSELSKSAILSSPQKGIKRGVRGESLFAKIAIVDPELTFTLPLKNTMETGFDVMAHAVESYISKASNRITCELSKQAIRIVAKNLPMLKNDLKCKQAREEVSYASMIMGINLSNASTVLPHRMQYPVGAITDTSHARGLIALFPSWMLHTYRYSTEKFNSIGELVSGKKCRTCEDVFDVFCDWMKSTCGQIKLADLGLQKTDLPKLIDKVQGNIGLDPAGLENGIIEHIYQNAF